MDDFCTCNPDEMYNILFDIKIKFDIAHELIYYKCRTWFTSVKKFIYIMRNEPSKLFCYCNV